MSKDAPKVSKFMTSQPHTAGANETIADAKQLMSEFQIRHLPIMDEGKLVGVVSDRDIMLFCGFSETDPYQTPVRDICIKNPYTALPDVPLAEVSAEMSEKHHGCAVIVQNEKVVGIFTTVDACRALSEIIDQRYHH